jgi:arginase
MAATNHRRAPAAPSPLVLVPTNAGKPAVAGLRRGPAQIAALLDQERWQIHTPPVAASIGQTTQTVAALVASLVAKDHVPFIAGGDHTAALGGFVGVRQGLRERLSHDVPLFILWLDAHPDVNTPGTSPSGNLHGMVLSGLLGYGPLAIHEPIPPERVVLAGSRDPDPGEVAFLAARPQIERWDAALLRRSRGWERPLSAFLARIAHAKGRLYVSLDLDVFDPRFAPGVTASAPNGAYPGVVLALLRDIAASGLLTGADVVELAPDLDRAGATARLAAAALDALAGASTAALQAA